MTCDHKCSSNCRREGCNCEHGEWHEMPEMENMKNAFDTFTAQADTFLAKSTSAQRDYIGSLLYKAGMGHTSAGKVQEYCNELTSKEASTVINYLKAHGIKGLDMYDSEEEVVPERIRDILKKSFTTV